VTLEALRATAAAQLRGGDPSAGRATAVAGLARFPDDADLLRIAGNCALVAGDDAAAVGWYDRAIAADPRAVEPRINLGLLHRRHHRIDAARWVLRECLAIDPVNRAAWLNLASTFVNEGEPEAGEGVVREAIARVGDLAELRWTLALLLLERQQWREGWRHYAARRMLPGFFPAPWSAVDRSRRLDDLALLLPGDRVVCHGEQGLGDEILFASMLREFAAAVRARGATVSLACHPRLRSVFAASLDLPLVDPLPDAATIGPGGIADWVVACGDLGRFHRNAPADFPRHRGYLTADAGRVAQVRRDLAGRAAGRPVVGIAWSGGRPRTHAAFRRIPLEAWLPLLRRPACFVSLQYADDAAEVEDLRRRHGVEIVRLPRVTMHDDYAETFALVANLDLVVCVPTSVLHVAGSLGRPCWVVMDRRAAWRECSADRSLPWYPRTHARFVRPAGDADWTRVMEGVSAGFAARLAEAPGGADRFLDTAPPG
jgi:hypothetical protein